MVAGSLLVAHVTAGDKASLQLIMINLDEIETAFPMQAAVQASYELHCSSCHVDAQDNTLVATDYQGAVILQAKRNKKEMSKWMQYGIQIVFTGILIATGWYQYKRLTEKQKENKEKALKR